jgi:hypothetical protein
MDQNIIKISVIDGETGELIEMEIDEECLKEMDRVHEEHEKRHIEAMRLERELERYDRD